MSGHFTVKKETRLYEQPKFLLLNHLGQQIGVVYDEEIARLITAAPDLYEKLKEFVEHALYTIDLSSQENRAIANIVNPAIDLLQKIETP